MTPEQRIDEALDAVLHASGSKLRYFEVGQTLDRMRNAMRKIMSDAYIAGSNANTAAAQHALDELAKQGQENGIGYEP